METMTFSLSKPVTAEALSALRADTARALDAGAKTILVDIDDVGTLESDIIATLIRVLRDARDHAAVLSLSASRKKVLETLHITALDRVFTVVTPLAAVAGETPPKPARRFPKRARRVASLALALAFAFGALAVTGRTPVAAEIDVTPLDAVRNVIVENARVPSYQAKIAVVVQLRSFPYLAKTLSGTTYFKRPDNYEVVFDSVPAMAKGFDKLYSDADDATGWERRFVLSSTGEKTVDGHRDVAIRLVQRVRGMIDYEDVAIDPSTWKIDSMEWHYYNGGVISMSQSYQNVGGFSVLASQHATIRIPYVHAAADAVYSGYKTNVAIDDAVFTKDKH
jgi:anti-anti-sigma regulatory factor